MDRYLKMGDVFSCAFKTPKIAIFGVRKINDCVCLDPNEIKLDYTDTFKYPFDREAKDIESSKFRVIECRLIEYVVYIRAVTEEGVHLSFCQDGEKFSPFNIDPYEIHLHKEETYGSYIKVFEEDIKNNLKKFR